MILDKGETGICPICDSDNLQYEEKIIEIQTMVYPYLCLNCQHKGKEVYIIEFAYNE